MWRVPTGVVAPRAVAISAADGRFFRATRGGCDFRYQKSNAHIESPRKTRLRPHASAPRLPGREGIERDSAGRGGPHLKTGGAHRAPSFSSRTTGRPT